MQRSKWKKLLRKGNQAAARGDYEAASKYYREYLLHEPDDGTCLYNLGVACSLLLKGEKDPVKVRQLRVDAMDAYGRAVLSRDTDIETKANCLNNAGLLAVYCGEPLVAKRAYAHALNLCPDHRAARVNYADVLVHDGDFEAADRQFFEIINSDPQSAGAQFSRSMIHLLFGDIRRGFMEYRSRYNVPSFVSKMLATDKPLWGGEPLDGKTLVIQHEQGWGDAIMFIRYAEVVKLAYPNCRIIYHGPGPIHPLMRAANGVDECVESEPPKIPVEFEHDYHAPLMHLPDICGTTAQTIPAFIPYITPREDWLPFPLPATDKPKKIGLVWAGSPVHGKDKFRSMTPAQFQRFVDAASFCQFYSLQCGPRQAEGKLMRDCIDLAPMIYDWSQTANALLQMDLLITVDTACAHLSGALGRPTWLLLPNSPDFRWMLGRPDSPWYPTMRLFRQQQKNDWEPVIAEVCAALANFPVDQGAAS